MKLLLDNGFRKLRLVADAPSIAEGDAVRFTSTEDALQFLQQMARDPSNLSALRSAAMQDLQTARDRGDWDTDLLEVLAHRLAVGSIHLVPAERKEEARVQRTGIAPPQPAPEAEAAYVYARPQDSGPAAPAPQLHWIEIELVGEDDEPISGVAYEITLPDESVRKGRLNKEGYARVNRIKDAGTCQVRFPELDKAAWEKIETVGERPR